MLKKLTDKYIAAFNDKNLNEIAMLFSNNFVLEDPVVKRIEGKDQALEAINDIFNSCKELSFKAKNVYIDGQTTLIEFILKLDDTTITGVDIIEWDGLKMKQLRAYLSVEKD